MKILAIDTSSSAAGVALFKENRLMGEFVVNTAQTHSQKLMPIVDSLLNQTQTAMDEIDTYYVCEGPGSFTGVRIGIAAVKGFAQPFGKKVFGYSSMFLLACNFRYESGYIFTAIDAKRGDVYYGVYTWQDDRLIILEEGIEVFSKLLPLVAEKYKDKPVILAGDVIAIYPDAVKEWSGRLSRPEDVVQRVGNLHVASIVESDAGSVYEIKANYMRKSQAERDK